MCDANTQAILEQIVRQKVSETRQNGNVGAMFTAFDISRTAQQSHGVRERHVYMKNDIHRLFSQGNMVTPDGRPYVRTTISLPGVPVDPWLYYPQGDDPTEYVSQHTGVAPTAVLPSIPAVPALPPSSSPVLGVVTVADPDADDDLADNQKRVDARGRVWVPVRFISGLGLTTGNVAYAVKGANSTLTVKANLGPSDVEAVAYKVDPSGNVAVSKGCLVEAGVVSDVVEIEGDATSVSIKNAVIAAPVAVGV